MSDLISRSAVIKALEECHLDKNLFEKDVFEKIDSIPTAYDVEKVVDIIREDCYSMGFDESQTEILVNDVRKGGVK